VDEREAWLTVTYRPQPVPEGTARVWWLAQPDGHGVIAYVFADWSVNTTPGLPRGRRLEFTDPTEARHVADKINERLGQQAVVLHEGPPEL
jgi:hypothetical protein